MLAGIVNRDNIGMGELGNETGLQVEAFNKVAVGGKPGRKNLDSNIAVKIFLAGFIDTRHSSLAKGSQDSIVSKRRTNQSILLHVASCGSRAGAINRAPTFWKRRARSGQVEYD